MSIHANRNLGTPLETQFNETHHVAITLRDDHVLLGDKLGAIQEGLQVIYMADRFVKVPVALIRYIEVDDREEYR